MTSTKLLLGEEPIRTGAILMATLFAVSLMPAPVGEWPVFRRLRVTKKLFTREDKGNFHKMFGILSLSSFIYRYCIVMPRTGTLGFDGSAADWAAMLAHTLLSTSALVFKVPAERMRKLPTVIYEEYRQHAILFSWRCMAVFTLTIVMPPDVHFIIRLCTVLVWHVMADNVTQRWGTPGQTAVRGADKTKRKLIFFLRRLFAIYQFMALGSHLIPHARASDFAFDTLIAIQSSSFLMTLHRKGLIRWYSHTFWYTVCLALSSGYMVHAIGEDCAIFVAGVLLAFFCRTILKMNKYVIWFVFALVGSGDLGASLDLYSDAFNHIVAMSVGLRVSFICTTAVLAIVITRVAKINWDEEIKGLGFGPMENTFGSFDKFGSSGNLARDNSSGNLGGTASAPAGAKAAEGKSS